mmetsp:Transcript_76260/g.203942  ORF Transcript_76260/g.203942 Transcript_76260/m.203942 type:complete len:251 (-) Transcript_76260:686-1438(-)
MSRSRGTGFRASPVRTTSARLMAAVSWVRCWAATRRSEDPVSGGGVGWSKTRSGAEDTRSCRPKIGAARRSRGEGANIPRNLSTSSSTGKAAPPVSAGMAGCATLSKASSFAPRQRAGVGAAKEISPGATSPTTLCLGESCEAVSTSCFSAAKACWCAGAHRIAAVDAPLLSSACPSADRGVGNPRTGCSKSVSGKPRQVLSMLTSESTSLASSLTMAGAATGFASGGVPRSNFGTIVGFLAIAAFGVPG